MNLAGIGAQDVEMRRMLHMRSPYNYPPDRAIQACHGVDNVKSETFNLKSPKTFPDRAI